MGWFELTDGNNRFTDGESGRITIDLTPCDMMDLKILIVLKVAKLSVSSE
jgi:hypothetical protein